MSTPSNADDLDLTDIEAVKASMTERRLRFCREYVIRNNATDAARAAGYSAESNDSLRVEGSRLLTFANVKAYIAHLRKHTAEAVGISPAWVAQKYVEQASVGVAEVYTGWMYLRDFDALPAHVKASIKKIDFKVAERADAREEQVKIEFYDKQTALKGLRDMLGFDAPKRTALTDKDGEDLDITGAVIVIPAAAKSTPLDETRSDAEGQSLADL